MACKHKPLLPGYRSSNYPEDVGEIIITRCAVSGCHNDLSYEAAAGLNLSSWWLLGKGANSGSVVIPYRPDYSSLCYFTNTDTSIGVVLQPTMPINQSPLSKEEYLKLVGWITSGAPSATGEILFSGNTSASKFYVTNRMCDVVTVFDNEQLLQARYIDVGVKQEREFPVNVTVAPDKKYWYVSFYAPSGIVQKFDAGTDAHVADIYLGTGKWHSMAITANSRFVYFADNSSTGKIVYADLQEHKVLAEYDFGNKLKYPSGISIDEQAKVLRVGTQSGNFIYHIDIQDPLNATLAEVPIDGTTVINYASSLGPVALIADPAASRCYIACRQTSDIRILDTKTNKLTGKVALNTSPAFLALSTATGKLFVSCPDDETTFPGNRGSVMVIDINAKAIVAKIKTGYQPYGLSVDEQRGRVVVVNANISSEGPASHHASRCGEKNGNVSFIDLHSLKLIPNKKREVAVFPYAVSIR